MFLVPSFTLCRCSGLGGLFHQDSPSVNPKDHLPQLLSDPGISSKLCALLHRLGALGFQLPVEAAMNFHIKLSPALLLKVSIHTARELYGLSTACNCDPGRFLSIVMLYCRHKINSVWPLCTEICVSYPRVSWKHLLPWCFFLAPPNILSLTLLALFIFLACSEVNFQHFFFPIYTFLRTVSLFFFLPSPHFLPSTQWKYLFGCPPHAWSPTRQT